ncbi:MAG: hypothetical protein VZS44_04165 [Bacilli bacterium]|nr:hypothetical protein [Bacilli bacterium]
MDLVLVILVVAIVLVALFFKDFKSVVYFLGIIEIFLRLVYRIADLIKVAAFNSFLKKYIPTSLESVINAYSSGILNIVLIWVLILLFVFFEWYLIKYWLGKKK